MLVSFIIPSYNSAHTIIRCLDSIYALSLQPSEFEVLFIDDCSTDDTCDQVAEYQSSHSDITLLRQPKNNRQGAARNRGVTIAKGEYICFVDSDDAVTDGVVAAIRLAKEKQTDMTAYHYAFVNETGKITKEAKKLSFAEGQIFSGIDMQNIHPYWCSGPVAYIYNRRFLEDVNYPFCEGVLYEDSDFVAVHLYYAKRMAYFPELGYIAYYREGSTTHSTTYKNVADYFLLGMRMLAFHERIKDEILCMTSNVSIEGREKFAEGILEGACWNVEKSCKRLVTLDFKEVRSYYDRLDSMTNRIQISADQRLRRYYWNIWTSICIRHKNLAIVMLFFIIPFYRTVKTITALFISARATSLVWLRKRPKQTLFI